MLGERLTLFGSVLGVLAAAAVVATACGSDSGGSRPGGVATGGAEAGGAQAGGAATGGGETGGAETGGAATGGGDTGGAETGGAATGGGETGGAEAGGAATGGGETGGAATGGVAAGGADSGGAGGAPDVGPGFECDTETEAVWEARGSTEDGTVAFVLYRCVGQICAGGCNVSDVYFSLSYQGRSDQAESELITYTFTHHNWADSLVAVLPDRQLKWRVVYDYSGDVLVYLHYVSVEGLDGSVILPETEILEE